MNLAEKTRFSLGLTPAEFAQLLGHKEGRTILEEQEPDERRLQLRLLYKLILSEPSKIVLMLMAARFDEAQDDAEYQSLQRLAAHLLPRCGTF